MYRLRRRTTRVAAQFCSVGRHNQCGSWWYHCTRKLVVCGPHGKVLILFVVVDDGTTCPCSTYVPQFVRLYTYVVRSYTHSSTHGSWATSVLSFFF